MKKRALLVLALLGILFTQTVKAQTYKQKLANSPDQTVEFVVSGNPISIKGYSGNQLIIKNTNYQAPPKQAAGMHLITGNGAANTGIGLSIHEEDGVFKVIQATNGGAYTVKIPDQVHLKIRHTGLPGVDVQISHYKGEIDVKTLIGNINLENVTGPIVAHSTSGNIKVIFSDLSGVAPSSISNISGDIDIALPPKTRADINLSTISGDMYTNFNIATGNKKKKLSHIGGRDINGTINGGGVKLHLKTISGNIYLRKR